MGKTLPSERSKRGDSQLSRPKLWSSGNVRGGFITQSQLMRGFEGWFTDIILNPEPLCDLMDRALQYQIDLAHSLLRGAEIKRM